MEVERANVLGVRISVIDQSTARDFLFEALHEGRRGYVAVTGVHGISEAQRDREFRRVLNEALLCTPDGMPTVWMARLQGHDSIERVYGPDLLLNICAHSAAAGFTHFFYGGKPGVADKLARALEQRFAGLRVVGTYAPPFRPLSNDEIAALQQQVRETRPDFFWVGLSTPKQECFMATHLALLPEARIFVGVGAAFDLLTGEVRQAPLWMQRSSLEWLFRLSQEPRRLWRRYLLNNPLFVARAAAQLLGLREYKLETPAAASVARGDVIG